MVSHASAVAGVFDGAFPRGPGRSLEDLFKGAGDLAGEDTGEVPTFHRRTTTESAGAGGVEQRSSNENSWVLA